MSTFYTIEQLSLALNFAKDSAKQAFIPDYFRHQDFVHNSEKLLRNISRRLKNKEYKAHHVQFVDIPKSGLTTRPGSMIEFSDLVVLFAAICSFASEIDKKMPDNVYSFRVNPHYKEPNQYLFEDRDIKLLPAAERKKLKRFEEWYEAWPGFEKAAKNIIDSGEYEYLVVSDITAYYENINHEVLRHILESEHKKCYAVNLIMECLREWTVPLSDGYKINRGIPQGNHVSSFLGNIFLLPLDRELTKLEAEGKIKYIRYMDDVKIFAKELKEAKKALFTMNDVLRKLQLNIQGAKTDIYPKEEFHKFISNENFDKLNDLVEEILKKENDNPAAFRKMIPKYLKKIKSFNGYLGRGKLKKDKIRYFKRLLTGYTHLGRAELSHRCFNALEDTPVVTAKIVKYFKTFVNGERIPQKVYEMLKDDDLFEYQDARLIEMFWHKKEIPADFQKLIMSYAKQKALNWTVRMNAFLALSVFPLKTKERKDIYKLFIDESNFRVRKAILLCLIQAPADIRQQILDEALCDTDYRVALFSKFLKDIANDTKTQRYELKNLSRIPNKMFIEESYKLILLKESSDTKILNKFQEVLQKRRKQKSLLPYHTRVRISQTYQEVKGKIKELKEIEKIRAAVEKRLAKLR